MNFIPLSLAGLALYLLNKGANTSDAVKKLQFVNPRVKLGKVSLLNTEATVTMDVYNPTSTVIPVDYLAGNVLYQGRNVTRFNVDGKSTGLKIKAQGTTTITFSLLLSNAAGIQTILNVINNLFGGPNNASAVIQVQGIFYALGIDLPFNFYYDVMKGRVMSPAVTGIGSVKATLEFGNNKEMEKYFTQKRMEKKILFSKN